MKLPEHIYKYQKIDQNTLIGLKNSQVYFARPSQFNDPYDCNHNIELNLSELEISKYRELQKKLIPERKSEIEKMSNERIIDQLKGVNTALMIKKFREDKVLKSGILCLSELNNSQLMWAHYADSYKGICLEFSTTYTPFNEIFPVEYNTKNSVEISFSKILLTDQSDDEAKKEAKEEIRKFASLKFTEWKYEKEWREIHLKGGSLFCYEQQALTGVYFGPHIDESLREIICLIIQGNNNHTKFHEGKLSDDKFEITFEEKSYTSFIKTKCQ